MVSNIYQDADICDVQALETLLSYLPDVIRVDMRRRMFRTFELFNRERHLEVVEVVNKILWICENIAPELPQVIRGKAIREAYDATEAVQTPTFFAVQLFIRFVMHAPFYKTSTSRVKACKLLQDNIEDNQGWNCVKAYGNGCGTFYRFNASSKKHFFKVISDLPVSAIYVCCVIMEVDLFSDWIPFCCRLHNQGEVSHFHKALFFVVKGVWPFSDRDLFLEGYGVDDLESNRRIWVVAQSLDETRDELPRGIQPPPCVEGSLRCEAYNSGLRIDVTSPTTTRLSLVVSIDPKIPVIPQTVINWVSGKIMWQIMTEISRAATVAQDRQSKYFSRRRGRPEMYSMLREHFNETFEKMDPQGYKHHAIPEDY
ncbi:unnamed protein product [Phytomonas sp. EM1]|nr:unnamed protein product [Phytomonas sp. EM1]|eukprot:CCW61771.1 unnamed protein product [Phytomonas sp. isolate EM1]